MNNPPFLTRQCNNDDCNFRFPVNNDTQGVLCPKCGSPTEIISSQFANLSMAFSNKAFSCCHIEAVLDNIRSAYNVGSIFRIADGSGIKHLHLCGITPTPDHRRIVKTALGAECSVPWTYHNNGINAARMLKNQGYQIWALEREEKAQSIFDAIKDISVTPIALVVGNEVSGVDPEFAEICERFIYIPMMGYKQSLNVANAFGIAAYMLCFAPSMLETSN